MEIISFFDDSYIEESNFVQLKEDMEKSFEAICKWLRQSGLKVNEVKTEMCLFHKNNHAAVQIELLA
jgi:hypothetical protein